ncbi:hypothetical protein OTU49_004999 [Cherax quadricarinatus]|uniref:Uncharacterized protein n=1 Tax=Cherax quadricarinatus TaxID=27406 RepID=A0AAW0WXV5_CHEQU|nr:uncharacterized protein LOC128697450 [Cherax quadricarinatus]
MSGEGGSKVEEPRMECEVGGVHHVMYRCPPRAHNTIRTRVVEGEGGRDGRVFPYLAHYLVTGDMLYPAHEGEVMVSRLLHELTKLDLVDDLLHARPLALTACVPKTLHRTSSGGGRLTVVGDGHTLKINTRRSPRLSLSSLLTHLLPAHTPTSTVYRPPSNKGTTLVVVTYTVQRSTEVRVQGPAWVLRSVFPEEVVHNTDATYPQLDSHVTPNTTVPELLNTLALTGYLPTLRSSWVESGSGALVTQWLVYRKGVGSRASIASSTLRYSSSSSTMHLSDSRSGRDKSEGGEGTLRSRLKTRSKSIMSLASEHTQRPTLTLKRILSVLL